MNRFNFHMNFRLNLSQATRVLYGFLSAVSIYEFLLFLAGFITTFDALTVMMMMMGFVLLAVFSLFTFFSFSYKEGDYELFAAYTGIGLAVAVLICMNITDFSYQESVHQGMMSPLSLAIWLGLNSYIALKVRRFRR